jgi:ABC-2 type transport system permease protein
MSRLRLFFVAGWRSHMALFRWMRPSAFIPTVIGVPAVQLIWFVHLGRYLGTHPVSYYAVGNAIHACAMAGLFAPSMSIMGERFGGTLTAVLASPANRIVMFSGRVLPAVLVGGFTTAVMLGLGTVVADVSIPGDQLLPLALALVVTAASCSAFGLIIGAVGLRTREATLLANLFLYLMLLLSGVNIPTSALPRGLAVVGNLLPMAQGIQAARHTLTGSGGTVGLLAVELAKTVVYLGVAIALLVVLERSSRRHARLDGA